MLASHGQSVQCNAVVAMGIVFTNVSGLPLDVSLADDSSGLPGAQLADLALSRGQSIGPFPPGNPATFVRSGDRRPIA
jgi:hypothetical protein